MLIRVSNSSQHIDKVKIYRDKSLEELKTIKPKWAYQENVDKILDVSIHPRNNEFTIFHVLPIDLISKADLYEIDLQTLFNGITINDCRIAGILYRWDNGNFVDPPNIHLHPIKKDKLTISDGRHRSKLTFFLQHEVIPVAVHFSVIKRLSKIIDLSQL